MTSCCDTDLGFTDFFFLSGGSCLENQRSGSPSSTWAAQWIQRENWTVTAVCSLEHLGWQVKCPVKKGGSSLQVAETSCLKTDLLIKYVYLLTTEKAALRPSRSMESLCSLPTGEFHGINFSLLSNCLAVIITGELMMLLIWPRWRQNRK